MLSFYSDAVIYLPNKTIETAGTNIPIIGTNIGGSQLATMSEDITFKFNF